MAHNAKNDRSAAQKTHRQTGFARRLMISTLVMAAAVTGGGAEAQITAPAPIESRSLTANAFETGTLSRRDGAMPARMWEGSKAQALMFLLDNVPRRPALPAIGHTARRVLLSPAKTPAGLDRSTIDLLSGRKLLALVNAGFIEEARTIASLSDASRIDPATGRALAMADLLTSRDRDACTRGANLQANREDVFWVKLRAFCYAVAGERDAADLTYGLLRDRGALSPRDEVFLGALVIGIVPDKPLQPKSALELAIVRQLGQPMVAGLSADTDGAVVRAVTLDTSLNPVTRIYAARTAMRMGIMSAQDYGALLNSVSLTPEQVAAPMAALRQSPDNPITEAVLYQSVRQMGAPEFLRDKAALIAAALSASNRPGASFDEAFARHVVYADDVATFEGALVPPADAAQFARARLGVGDGAGAGRWLFAMQGDEPITALGDDLAQTFVGLVADLNLIDPVTAKIVADSANIAITDPFTDQNAVADSSDVHSQTDLLAVNNEVRTVEAVFDAAMGEAGGKKQGQAALAALAMASSAPLTPLQNVVLEQAITIAGLDDLRGQLRLQALWQARHENRKGPTPYTNNNGTSQSNDDEDRLSPRLKPRSRG